MKLDADFEQKAQRAILDDVERKLVGEQGGLVFEAIQQSHDRLRDFADEYPGVESVIESVGTPQVSRTESAVTVTWGWTHDAAELFELGTAPHTVEGDPLLVFEFDPAEYPYLDDMFPEGTAFLPDVHVDGLRAVRYTRWGLRWLRHQLREA